MTKGRHYVPSTNREGIWYRHRGLPDWGPHYRENSTSTGLMLTAPFNPEMSSYPPNPPVPYVMKDSRNFKTVNSFSAHDNRHSFQGHGVYLGNGRDSRSLGRRVTAPTQRQHHTEKDFLKHCGRTQTDYDYTTNYTNKYRGNPCEQEPAHRRFPKQFPELDQGLAKVDTTTTSWYKEPDVPHKTPTNVLAVSQEPFLRPNKWKYSYHGLPKCYPPYDRLDRQKHVPVWLLPKVNEPEVIMGGTVA